MHYTGIRSYNLNKGVKKLMDWSTNPEKKNHHHTAAVGPAGHTQKSWAAFRGLRIASVALLFSTTILVIALLGSVVIETTDEEGNYVDTNKLQAVYMDNSEVYYGRITSVSSSYIRLSNVHYLRDKAGSPNEQASDVLEKLGCDVVARPTAEILINRDHVNFWENSKENGNGDTVSAAVKKYLAADPEGHGCQSVGDTKDEPAEPASSTSPTTSTTPAPSTSTPPRTTTPNTTPNQTTR